MLLDVPAELKELVRDWTELDADARMVNYLLILGPMTLKSSVKNRIGLDGALPEVLKESRVFQEREPMSNSL